MINSETTFDNEFLITKTLKLNFWHKIVYFLGFSLLGKNADVLLLKTVKKQIGSFK